MKLKSSWLALAITLSALATEGTAADWPDQPVTIQLTTQAGAGSAGDILARYSAQFLQKYLGTNATIVVINMPGAGGEIAYNDLAAAAPDGTKINVATVPPIISRIAEGAETKYTLDSFAFLGRLTSSPAAIAVAKDSPMTSLQQLVEEAKAKPEQVTVAVAGIGNDDHLALLQLMSKYDLKLRVVPFDTGPAAVNAVLGGHTQAGTMSAQEATVTQKETLRTLAVFGDERIKAAPDVPTAKEQGFEVIAGPTRVFAIPAGTPQNIIDAYAEAVDKMMDDTEFRDLVEKRGFTLDYLNPADTKTYVAGELDRLSALFKEMPWR